MKNRNIKRGDIYYADMGSFVGSEQGGVRPVLIVQNDIGNKYSPTTIVVSLTSKQKNDLPTHVHINGRETGLDEDSTVLCEQVRTIDKTKLKWKIGHINKAALDDVANSIKISLNL